MDERLSSDCGWLVVESSAVDLRPLVLVTANFSLVVSIRLLSDTPLRSNDCYGIRFSASVSSVSDKKIIYIVVWRTLEDREHAQSFASRLLSFYNVLGPHSW